MKQKNLSLLLVIALSINHTAIKSNTIDTVHAQLEENNKLLKALLTSMLHNAEREKEILEETRRTMAAEDEAAQKKQLQRQQLQQEYENRPWYLKTWDITSMLVTQYLLYSLLPEIQRGITIRLADKSVQLLCNGVDMVTGDIVENRWGSCYALRPGEWLYKTSAGRKQAQTKRDIARNHPDIPPLAKELEKLKKELYPSALRSHLHEELERLRELKRYQDYKPQRQEQQFHTDSDARATLYQRYISGQPIVEEAE